MSLISGRIPPSIAMANKVSKGFCWQGLRPPKAALRALDNKSLSKQTAAIAIDGFL
jgi:hypothetical protein